MAAAIWPKSYGSSTTGVKKSVVTTSARRASSRQTAASSGAPSPTSRSGFGVLLEEIAQRPQNLRQRFRAQLRRSTGAGGHAGQAGSGDRWSHAVHPSYRSPALEDCRRSRRDRQLRRGLTITPVPSRAIPDRRRAPISGRMDRAAGRDRLRPYPLPPLRGQRGQDLRGHCEEGVRALCGEGVGWNVALFSAGG